MSWDSKGLPRVEAGSVSTGIAHTTKMATCSTGELVHFWQTTWCLWVEKSVSLVGMYMYDFFLEISYIASYI